MAKKKTSPKDDEFDPKFFMGNQNQENFDTINVRTSKHFASPNVQV